ncbi:MAG: hypothetical protein HYZ53_07960 [Planctomycetes bacterium]|nr:hypothetical protein [Planctomycetota bacterium]
MVRERKARAVPALVALGLALLAALPAEAKIPIVRAKELLYEFVTRGGQSVGLTLLEFEADLEEVTEAEDEVLGPLYMMTGPRAGSFQISSEDGTVFEATRNDAFLKLPSHDAAGRAFSREDLLAAARATTTLPAADMEERARAYVRGRYRNFELRRFKVVRKGISLFGTVVSYDVELREQSASEEVAIFPNRVIVGLHPKSGRIVSYACSDLRLEIPARPKISQVEAQELARGPLTRYLDPANGFKLLEVADSRLSVYPASDRKSGWLVWSFRFRFEGRIPVERIVAIDAGSGSIVKIAGR